MIRKVPSSSKAGTSLRIGEMVASDSYSLGGTVSYLDATALCWSTFRKTVGSLPASARSASGDLPMLLA